MAVIPEFQRQRLASSVVGTLGVDTSESALLGTLADVAEDVEEAEQKRRVKRQDISDSINADSATLQYGQDLEKRRRELKEDPDTFFKEAMKLRDERLKTLTGGAQEAFSSQTLKMIEKQRGEADVEHQKNIVSNSATTLDKSIQNTHKNTYDTFSNAELSFPDQMRTFRENLANIGAMTTKASGLLTPKVTREVLDKAEKEAVKNAVFGLLDTNPEQVETFLKSEGVVGGREISLADPEELARLTPEEIAEIPKGVTKFKTKGILTQDEITDIRKQAADRIAKKAVLADKVKLQDQFALEGELSTNANKGEFLTSREIDILEQENPKMKEFFKRYRKRKSSPKPVFDGENVKASGDLANQFALLGTPKTKRGKKTFIFDEKTTFGDIAGFRQDVMEAKEQGIITDAQEATYLKAIAPKFDENIEQLLNEMVKKGIALKKTDTLINQAVTDENQLKLKTTFTQELMNAIDLEEDKLGNRLTPLRIEELSDGILENLLIGFQPNRGRYTRGRTLEVNGKTWKIIGFRLDGRMVLDDDLSRPVELVPFPSKVQK